MLDAKDPKQRTNDDDIACVQIIRADLGDTANSPVEAVTPVEIEIRQLNRIHINWSSWSPWTECSRSCGIGVRSRSRVCQDHRSICFGPAKIFEACNLEVSLYFKISVINSFQTCN